MTCYAHSYVSYFLNEYFKMSNLSIFLLIFNKPKSFLKRFQIILNFHNFSLSSNRTSIEEILITSGSQTGSQNILGQEAIEISNTCLSTAKKHCCVHLKATYKFLCTFLQRIWYTLDSISNIWIRWKTWSSSNLCLNLTIESNNALNYFCFILFYYAFRFPSYLLSLAFYTVLQTNCQSQEVLSHPVWRNIAFRSFLSHLLARLTSTVTGKKNKLSGTYLFTKVEDTLFCFLCVNVEFIRCGRIVYILSVMF